jgi:hypothetical protein
MTEAAPAPEPEDKTMKILKYTSRTLAFFGISLFLIALISGFKATHIAERRLGIKFSEQKFVT